MNMQTPPVDHLKVRSYSVVGVMPHNLGLKTVCPRLGPCTRAVVSQQGSMARPHWMEAQLSTDDPNGTFQTDKRSEMQHSRWIPLHEIVNQQSL